MYRFEPMRTMVLTISNDGHTVYFRAGIPLSCGSPSTCNPTNLVSLVRMLNKSNVACTIAYSSFDRLSDADFRLSYVFTRSGSMSGHDPRPLPDAPATYRIREKASKRLGAVYSALYSFWSARHDTVTSGQQAIGARRDACSIQHYLVR
ncbi:hypothetical protein EDB85DRAFT_581129 [Lactarius pseudohatsudake]|nr:hypothetical protein EDB85DRAFT_581129 [Lactarius pseudohatsudake]